MKSLILLVPILIIGGCVDLQLIRESIPSVDTGQQPQSPESPPKLPLPKEPQQKQDLDNGSLGSLNHQYLQSQPFSKIIIEIDYIQGYEPTASTKNVLKDFFRTIANKPDISFSGGNLITPRKNIYTVSYLQAVESENRQHHTSRDTAVIYFMFLNGQFETPSALGVAYKASSATLFVERISDATTALILYSQIEKAVTTHELGHLLGLVNINYESERNHEDSAHPHHSTNKDSVMFWAVEDITLKNVLNFGPPSTFDEDDFFDIQQIKNGVY